jgi:type II secretory pathway pseudopilin PulG
MGSRIARADGFALVDVLFVVGIIGVVSAIAVPNMTLARESAMSASAIATLRSLNSAQLTFALTCGGGFYAPNLTTLGTRPPMAANAFVSPDLGSADIVEKSGYRIQVASTALPDSPPTCNGLPAGQSGPAFRSGADSLLPGNSRFFASNAGNVIYEHTSSLWGVIPEIDAPPVGEPLAK